MKLKTWLVKPPGRKIYVVRWVDPENNKPRQKSTGCRRKSEAAAVQEALEKKLNKGVDLNDLGWAAFRLTYEEDKLCHLAKKTRNLWNTAANALEEICKPDDLDDITPRMLARFSRELRSRKIADASIAAYLRMIRAALNWAYKMRIVADRIHVEMPPRANFFGNLPIFQMSKT